MAVNNPFILTIPGGSSYDLSKVVSWWEDTVSGFTKVRFDGIESTITVPLPTAEFEQAIQGGTSVEIISEQTAIGVGATTRIGSKNRTYMAVVTGTGPVYAKVSIQVSNDGLWWMTQAVLDLSGTNAGISGAALEGAWPYVRCVVVDLTGTDASVTVNVALSR